MPVPTENRTAERRLLRETAYVAIRDAIVAGTLAPGERLHDTELCDWLHLSRTPVRDALTRLEDEGLIETSPQRYTRVRSLTPQDARDSFPLLAVIHALAAELAVPRLGTVELTELRLANEAFVAAMEGGAATATYAADDRFHQVFVTACDNKDVVQALERMDARLHRLEILRTGALPGRRSVAQHEAIIARAAAGDATATASATRENWLTLGALVERTLAIAAVDDPLEV
ncbi:MAG: transcriptional regulator, GntR family [Solirubrobacterales bacterium]|nr:transcriptional regulator, GntR family [Solirubrobacterales bacterium]